MSILVTGASGFVGRALTEKLISQGHTVYGLSRKPFPGLKELICVVGDVLFPDLGMKEVPGDIEAVYHLAAIASLGKDTDGSIWRTNVEGTKSVIDFCLKYKIPHLYYCSTAYTFDFNVYGQSKIACESYIKTSGIPKVTIFKPSIVLPSEGEYYTGNFSQFVSLTISTLKRVRIAWRKIEETMRLPVLLEPVFRVKGNPEGELNLIRMEQVIDAMTSIKEQGSFWLTNPSPPTVQQAGDWIGDIIMIKMKFISGDFTRMPAEILLDRKIAAFKPYLQGHNFKSDLTIQPGYGINPFPVTKDFVQDIVKSVYSNY
jgi:nucleoside-diphosphate-sugar epimerase